MKGVADAKGLRHLGTATTRRIRSRPPQRGTARLNMYLLSKEKQRLGQELAHLEDRRQRIQERLAGIQEDMIRLGQVAQREEAEEMPGVTGVEAVAGPAKPSPSQDQPQWKTMPLEY